MSDQRSGEERRRRWVGGGGESGVKIKPFVSRQDVGGQSPPCTCISMPQSFPLCPLLPLCKQETASSSSSSSPREDESVQSISVITALTSMQAVRVSLIVLTWHETHAGTHRLI